MIEPLLGIACKELLAVVPFGCIHAHVHQHLVLVDEVSNFFHAFVVDIVARQDKWTVCSRAPLLEPLQ
eukprot:6400500-Prymnesium_polylepis.1